MKKIFIIVLFFLIMQSNGALQMRNVRIEPEFATPGGTITVYLEAVHDYNKPVSFAGVLSENATWEAANDYLFWYSNGANKEALAPPIPQYNFSSTVMNEHLEWYEYSFTFIVPSTFAEGSIYNIIVKASQENTPFVSTINAEDEIVFPFEVASNKGVVYNTAYLGEKKSKAAFIMIDAEPPSQIEANPSNGIGNTYIYGSSSIKVELKTNDVAGAKIYYTLDGSVPTTSSSLYSDSVTIYGDDTLRAMAVVPGLDNSLGEWYYDMQLPQAKVSATPSNDNIYEYDTPNLNVNLKTNFGNTIVWQLLNLSDSTSITPWDTTTDSITNILISGDVIISIYTIGDEFESVDTMWAYDCELPDAKISATPSNNSIYEYDTPNLNVDLKTNFGNTIVWQLLNLSDSSSITPWDTTTDSIFNIQISGDVIISAYTIGDEFKSIDTMWAYDCNLPVLEVVAFPGDTSFNKSIYIELFSKYNDSLIDSEIKYIIDTVGQVYQSSEVKSSGLLYDLNSGITLTKSATIYAIAVNSNFSDGFNSFKYDLELIDATISVSPSKNPSYKIGHTLDTILITSNADSIKWIMSNSIKDSSEVYSNGQGFNLINNNFPLISESDSDTMYLSVVAFGHGYKTIYQTFKYVKQKLPNIVANYFDLNGYKFSLPHNDLNLHVPDSNNEFENVKIHFIVDSVYAGKYPDKSNNILSNGINMDKTMFVKAIAYADNAIKSEFFVGQYILAAGIVSAKYLDEDANGEIDAAIMNLTMPVSNLPDSIVFTSPFDNNEKVVVLSTEIEFNNSNNNIYAKLNTPLNYNHNSGSTAFIADSLGTIYGKHFVESSFMINDSVAPLVQKGIYKPGSIIQTKPKVERAKDTLILNFSEKINLDDIKNGLVAPVNLFNENTLKDYFFNLIYIDQDEKNIRFLVEDIVGDISYPSTGDKIKINVSKSVKDINNVVQQNEENREGILKVLELPYLLKIFATNPSNPSKMKIPNIYKGDIITQENGFLIIADFHMILPEKSKITSEIIILDQVGNEVTTAKGLGKHKRISIDIHDHSLKNSTQVIYVWDGKNRKGRDVAPGTYIANISVVDHSGKIIELSIPIGVKR